uniref:Ig-like domain-containing protein n=2 Tax=Pygocentrus nattereri TaxID=42514 RepID=A0AAR2JPQ1_PYGNA
MDTIKIEAPSPKPTPALDENIHLKTSAKRLTTISSQKEAPAPKNIRVPDGKINLKTSAEPSTTTSSQKETSMFDWKIKLTTSAEPSTTVSSQKEAPATKLTPTLSRNIQTSVEPTATISSQTGCTLEDSRQTKQITAYTQESVLLPCYCTDPRTTPERLIWKKLNPNTREWEDISSGSGQYRSRVQLVNGHSPGNLSLLISHLIEEDGGDYRCDVKQNEYILIRLTVKGNSPLTNARAEPPQSLPFVPFGLVTVIILHIIVAVVYHTKRNKVLETARIYYNSADEAVSL